MKLVKVSNFGYSGVLRKKDSYKIAEDSNRFDRISYYTIKYVQFNTILAHLKLSEINNNEVYKLISSEHGDSLLDNPKCILWRWN